MITGQIYRMLERGPMKPHKERNMKYVLIFLMIIIPMAVSADMITLNADDVETKPATEKINLLKIQINLPAKVMRIAYQRLDENLAPIRDNYGEEIRIWTCRNHADDPETPGDEFSTCFNDVFGFDIRSQDVGTALGLGLRNLIWNQMKQDILITATDGSFD